MFSRGALLSLAYLLTTVLAGTWKQCDSYSGKSFLTGFNHMTIADPTHGRVYVPPRPSSPDRTSNGVCFVILQELRQPSDGAQEEHHVRQGRHAHPSRRPHHEAQREWARP